MQKDTVLLLDADGVVIDRDQYFSHILAQELGIDIAHLESFFKKDFQQCIVGQADLKETIKSWIDKWGWQKSVDDLLEYWFNYENKPNQEVIRLIKECKDNGLSVYLATNQEKYRARYMVEEMEFLSLFDHCFFSYEMKTKKPQEKFYQYVWDSIEYMDMLDDPSQILFFDDTEKNVEVANKFGFSAHIYDSPQQIQTLLHK